MPSVGNHLYFATRLPGLPYKAYSPRVGDYCMTVRHTGDIATYPAPEPVAVREPVAVLAVTIGQCIDLDRPEVYREYCSPVPAGIEPNADYSEANLAAIFANMRAVDRDTKERPLKAVTGLESRVLALLAPGPLDFDELIRKTGADEYELGLLLNDLMARNIVDEQSAAYMLVDVPDEVTSLRNLRPNDDTAAYSIYHNRALAALASRNRNKMNGPDYWSRAYGTKPFREGRA